MAATPSGGGYWMVASDGGIFAHGTAGFFGSTGAMALNKPIVGMAATPDGLGYWLVASDGGIFAFGSAGFYGSTGAKHLNSPIVGMASTNDGKGYWLVAADGGIFTFGDAHYFGSTGGTHLNKPVVGMAAGPHHRRVLVGGLRRGHLLLQRPLPRVHREHQPEQAHRRNGIRPSTVRGYRFVASDGGIFDFGSAKFYGSTGDVHLNEPVVGMASA